MLSGVVVKENAREPDANPVVAVAVKLVPVLTVGVPEMSPVGAIVKPEGRPVAEKDTMVRPDRDVADN
jgi:hypothetical protein